MKREFLITGDGSITIHLPKWNEQYHSRHGAIAEALHVFIENGLKHAYNTLNQPSLDLLEVGFGTGLNALLTMHYANEFGLDVHYTGVEAYPVSVEEVLQLNYARQLGLNEKTFKALHQAPWESFETIQPYFTLRKQQIFFSEIQAKQAYHLIYFDAFGARVQPELWTVPIFRSMFEALVDNGVLVTYAAKGSVRRAMQEVGFTVERLPGPPGKREMLRATKYSE